VTTVSTDVLVVGAGPTGLTLAAQLLSFGASFRIVDRQLDRVHESRALAVQPRTLEVLTGLGVADAMVERGNSAVRLQMHTGARTTEVPLFDIGLDDTAYPFLSCPKPKPKPSSPGTLPSAARPSSVASSWSTCGRNRTASPARCASTAAKPKT
jgi:hypothetical protein